MSDLHNMLILAIEKTPILWHQVNAGQTDTYAFDGCIDIDVRVDSYQAGSCNR